MKKLVLILAILALLPAAAQAGLITETWVGTGGLTVNLIGAPAINTLSGYSRITVGAPSDDMSPLVKGQTYDAYCVDLLRWSAGSMIATTHSFNGVGGWDLYSGGSRAAASYLLNRYAPVLTTVQDKAALQIAIWEVLYETDMKAGKLDWNVATGNVSFVGGSYSGRVSEFFLTANPQYAGDSTWILTTRPTRDTWQSFATASVPEPGSMMLFGVGLIGLAGVVRSRGKK